MKKGMDSVPFHYSVLLQKDKLKDNIDFNDFPLGLVQNTLRRSITASIAVIMQRGQQPNNYQRMWVIKQGM